MKERIIQFGPDGLLSGVLRESAAAGANGLMLFNAGVVHRIGAHRLNVKLARALHEPSLRFDLSGQGESPAAAAGLGFEDQAIADIAAAIDALENEANVDGVVAIGMCSGADHALRAAVVDPRISGVVLLDPYAYPNDDAAGADLLARAADPDRWSRKIKSLMLRRDDVGDTASGNGRRTGGGDEIDQGRPLAPKEEFAADLTALVQRGVRILIVYTGLVRRHVSKPAHFFKTFAAYDFEGRIDVEAMPHTDHTFSTIASQETLIGRVDEWLRRRSSAACDRRAS